LGYSLKDVGRFFVGRRVFIVLVSTHLLLGVMRAPAVLISGRFWAEEGSIMWSHARSSDALDSILFNPGGGYLNLYANLTTYVASLLEPEAAPFFTAWTSFLLALLPAAVIVGLPLRISISATWKTLIGFGLLFLPAVTEPDIFANSLQMQVHFGVFAATLMLVDFSKLNRITLLILSPLFLIAALSGAHAAVIGSVMFLTSVISQLLCRTSAERAKPRDLNTLMAGSAFVFGSIIQAAIFLINRSSLPEDVTHHRGRVPSPFATATYVVSNFSTIFSGRLLTEQILERSGFWILRSISLLLVGTLLAVFAYSTHVSLKRNSAVREMTLNCRLSYLFSEVRVQLVIAYCASTFITLFGFVSPLPNARYQTVSSVLLYFIVVFFVSKWAGKMFASFFMTTLGISSILGLAYDPWNFLTCREPCVEWLTQTREVDEGLRTRFEFWPLHASPPFDAPSSPPSGWCDDFNALLSWKCDG